MPASPRRTRASTSGRPRCSASHGVLSGGRLAALSDLFRQGVAVEPAVAAAAVDPVPPELLQAEEILQFVDGAASSLVRIDPWLGLLLAHDPYTPADLHPAYVAGGNRSAETLARATIRRPAGTALDLGTGAGMHALLMAPHAERVLAADINPRALWFTQVNARLNGIDNVETREGSLAHARRGRALRRRHGEPAVRDLAGLRLPLPRQPRRAARALPRAHPRPAGVPERGGPGARPVQLGDARGRDAVAGRRRVDARARLRRARDQLRPGGPRLVRVALDGAARREGGGRVRLGRPAAGSRTTASSASRRSGSGSSLLRRRTGRPNWFRGDRRARPHQRVRVGAPAAPARGAGLARRAAGDAAGARRTVRARAAHARASARLRRPGGRVREGAVAASAAGGPRRGGSGRRRGAPRRDPARRKEDTRRGDRRGRAQPRRHLARRRSRTPRGRSS